MTTQSPLIQAVAELKSTLDGRLSDSEKRLDEQNRNQAKLSDRLEALEAVGDRPSKPNSGFSSDEIEHKEVFTEWLRKPHDGHTKRRMDEAEHEMSKKQISIGTDSAGGYALPKIIEAKIAERARTLNPFLRICHTAEVGSSDYHHLVSRNEAGSGWVAELGTRSETDTSTLIDRVPTWGTLYAYPSASEEAMQDVFFNVGDWLTFEAAAAFASQLATAVVSGNGTAKPTGFLNSTPVTTTDDTSPERDPGTLEYIPMDSSSPQALHADDLFDLVGKFKDGYLLEGETGFVMRTATLTQVRKLKDSNGNYLLQPSLAQGVPPTLLGWPVYTTDAMQAYVADAYPIAFGNWRTGYGIFTRGPIRITIDDNVTTPGVWRAYIRQRTAGCILNGEALKVLKYADS